MSIMKSINTGLSGLTSNGRALGVVGDNIANSNTAGFKRGRANFADVLASTSLGIGSGTRISSTQQMFGQGDLELTGNDMDLAINGPGFLIVSGQMGGQNGDFYTRAGQFGLDAEGFVTTPGGLKLQGYGVNDKGEVDRTAYGDLAFGGVSKPPRATTSVELDLNLDAGAEVPADPWDPANPGDTSNYSSSVTVYDSLGNPIEADVYYRKTADNSWEYRVLVDGGSVTGGTAGTPTEITTGTLDFNTDGTLATHTPAAVNFQPDGATQPQDIAFTFEGVNQFASSSRLRGLNQDGFAVGELRGVEIGPDGTVMGSFSNGEQAALGQVAMANFSSPGGLDRMGGSLWKATGQSGEALVGRPNDGPMGSIVSGALEASNVDMAYEFVKLIAFQRGFQASSKAITTGDQMLNEVINLKR